MAPADRGELTIYLSRGTLKIFTNIDLPGTLMQQDILTGVMQKSFKEDILSRQQTAHVLIRQHRHLV